MSGPSNRYIELAEVAVQDAEQQAAVQHGTHNAYARRLQAMSEISPHYGEQLRTQAAAAKRRALMQLPDLLLQAERMMQQNGMTVLWAQNAAEACAHVRNIAQSHNARTATKSKSMMTEEIGLNAALQAAGLDVVETDLGEYILQLNDEPPSHIIAPVIHKSKSSIAAIFEKTLAMPPTDDAATMARHARTTLRAAFLASDIGISGGNFIIAETGAVALVTNEGNARMVTTLPKVHVAVIGIEKIVATVAEYAFLTQILARSATGQKLSVYTHLIHGPRRAGEPDGPEHIYVVLVDNGRSNIYSSDYVESLACIRCGACLNACPVYRQTGGHSYGSVYSGPIGAVITPLLEGLDAAHPLPFASTLCGACYEACPVKIDIPRMLLTLRRDIVAAGHGGRRWRSGIRLYERSTRSARRFRLAGKAGRLATRSSFVRRNLPRNGWTRYRTLPPFAGSSFRQQWQAQQQSTAVATDGD